MKTLFTLILTVLAVGVSLGQPDNDYHVNHNFDSYFALAYDENPGIPFGVLEATAWTKSRITHLTPSSHQTCTDLPVAHGVFGLVADGKNYFTNNAALVEYWFDEDILNNSGDQIRGYAKAYGSILNGVRHAIGFLETGEEVRNMHYMLSEFPDSSAGQKFAIDAELYQILHLLNDPKFMQEWDYEPLNIDLAVVFNENNLKVLSASSITINGDRISDGQGNEYKAGGGCLDYPTAIWVAADPSNYSSRSGTAISAITIHDIEGTYAGAISWFQNSSANVSAHYVLRSWDGQVTQMVCEADKGWHVGTENPYTIGLEHEGYASTPSWYTLAMYQASADVVKDICDDYSINPLRTYNGPACLGSSADCQLGGCIKVKGHQHYPNQTHTDPGIYWDWPFYYELINDSSAVSSYTASSGNLYDTGGPSGNYGDDERYYMLIEPASVYDITLTVNSFDVEYNWDYLYIYDGNSSSDPLIGQFTGTSISSSITSSGGAMLLEFRSDCSTTDPGWDFSWTSTPILVGLNDYDADFEFTIYPNPAGDDLHIQGDRLSQVEIIDITGRIALTTSNLSGAIDLSSFAPGIYQVRLMDETGHFATSALIIQ